jgi:hypothetical protein
LQKDFGFKIQKPTSKGILFLNENYFKLLPNLAKIKGDFVSKRKLLQVFCYKNHCLNKMRFHQRLKKTCLAKNLACENEFN